MSRLNPFKLSRHWLVAEDERTGEELAKVELVPSKDGMRGVTQKEMVIPKGACITWQTKTEDESYLGPRDVA